MSKDVSESLANSENKDELKHFPKVSIGLPVYNGEKFIRRALDSLLAQTFSEFEIIISDNASEDTTREICLEYAKHHRKIRYYRNETNIGAALNFNRVFELSSKGEYFKWATFDDYWDPMYLKKCVDVLERKPSVVLCSCIEEFFPDQGITFPFSARFIEAFSKPIGVTSTKAYERFHQMIWTSSRVDPAYSMIRTSILRKTRLMCTAVRPDEILGAELSLYGPFWHIPETLQYRRRHASRHFTETLKRNEPECTPQSACRYLRHVFELLKVVNRAPVNNIEKPRLLKDVLRYFIWHRDLMLQDVMRAIKFALGNQIK
jgi:glycosyltransferase involved in cell wall biosynthesis